MSAAMTARATWLADGLRWMGDVCGSLAERLERQSLTAESEDPQGWRDCLPPHERVFELRTRIQSGDY